MQAMRFRRWAGAAAAVLTFAPTAGVAQAAPDTRPTLAVMYFSNGALMRNADYAPLSKGIAELLITELSANTKIRVVERDQLQALIQEQNLGATDRVDKETAVRLGRILGARHFLMGGFVIDPKENVRLDVRAVNVETSAIDHAETVSGKAENLLALIEEIGRKVNNGLKLPPIPARAPSPAPREEAGVGSASTAAAPVSPTTSPTTSPAARPTVNTSAASQPTGASQTVATSSSPRAGGSSKVSQMRAVLFLGSGLNEKDRGNNAAAVANYREALQAYPKLDRAKVLMASLERPAGT